MNVKKTLGTIVALAFLGSGAAGCTELNKTLYHGKDAERVITYTEESSIKFEQVNSPMEWHSFNPDYRMTIQTSYGGLKYTIIDNNMDFRISAEGDDKFIVEMDGQKQEFDKTNAEEPLGDIGALDYANFVYTLVLDSIKDKLPKEIRDKMPQM